MTKQKSSGVKKAEKLQVENEGAKEKKTIKNNAPVKKRTVKSQNKDKNSKREKRLAARAQKRAEREERRVRLAEIRAERKKARLEKKLEARKMRLEKRAAAKKQRAEIRAEREKRRDMLKHESKEARRERILSERNAKIAARKEMRKARIAEKQAKREYRLKMRAERRAERNDRRHAPGVGGWLAAVISLGVTTLALGTMLTFGWLSLNGLQADILEGHMQSLYELNAVVDNLDANLSKARVARSESEQVKILSDIAIESEIAETILERFPVDMQFTRSVSEFVNKMGDGAQSMLYSVASGKKLTDSQIATIEHMYKRNAELKKAINDLTANMSEKDMLAAIGGKDGSTMSTTFTTLQNASVETPKEIFDGPFAENVKKSGAKSLEGKSEISAARAEELAKSYFKDYKLTGATCTGEVIAEQISCYNVTLYTADGEMTAQIAKNGGAVVEFNSFKDCANKNFSVDRCVAIAEDFLKSLKIEGMKAVWTSENGTVCNLNFAYEEDGVTVYPDMIKVKVCEERGIVTGMEGLAYVLNHTERDLPAAKISEKTAKAKLVDGFEITSSRLSLIPTDNGEETLAYEFCGTFGGDEYYIYLDAKTGDEVEVLRVIGTKQGRALM